MISMAAIKPLPIWNALRRSYLNPLFLLRPIVSLPALSQHAVVRSMVVGEKPVNRFCSSGVEKDAVHSPSEKRSSRKLGFRFLEFSETAGFRYSRFSETQHHRARKKSRA